MQQLLRLLMGLLCTASLTVQAELKIFACEPEWASLVEEIGGNKVQAYTATHAGQDPHHIRARPSLISKMRQADLIICSGAGLEAGWLPLLLQKAGAHVQPGSVGNLMASEFVPILEKPESVDRSMGDIHPEGNPHVHLNPHNIMYVANELSKRLMLLDASNAWFYQKQLESFSSRWQQSTMVWEKAAETLKASSVVVHHRAFSYLLEWLKIEQIASLEPKPGIPPTTSHLESLLKQLKLKPAKAIIRTPYEPNEASEWLSKKTGVTAIVLPYTIGGDDESNDLFTLFDRTIRLIKAVMHDKQ